MVSKKNFFISYTKADEQWAQWIAGQLEDKEYTTTIQAWDFKPGTNFVSNMHNTLIDCERFIAVISPDYFKSLYFQSEWTVAFTKDPSSEKALFIPVRVKECKPEGLFASVIYIDLYEIGESEAVERLLKGISTDRPRNRPGFPGTSNRPRFPGQLPFNNLPFRENPNFTGREDILEVIRKSFSQWQYQYTSLTQLVSGLRGVGKTQIVLEYAFRYGHLYDTIWWVNAESPFTLMESYSSFVYEKGLLDEEINEKDKKLEVIWNWMSQHKNWLFIYDAAEDKRSLYEYFPRTTTGHILITSQYANWYRLEEVIRIDVFKPEEAEDFLIRSTSIDDRKSAAKLAAKLGYFPLALEQAAAYIINNNITYEEYTELLSEYELKIFEGDGPKSVHYNIPLIWNISIEKIKNESSKQLLNICSFLAPDNIDRDIFTESNKYLPEPLASETLSELKYNKVISELVQYSLITLQNNKISIHRLLQEVIRQSLNKKEWLGYCLNIMYELFGFDYNNQNTWNKCSELTPHVLSVAKYSDELSIDLKKVAWLYDEAARWLEHTATYEEAETLLKRALEIREEVLGAKHSDTATSLNNLAVLYRSQGKYEEAEILLKRALEIREEVLGAKHPDTATSLNNLAVLYRSQGKYEEAEPLLKRALEIREEVLGAKHPDTASALNNLTMIYTSQGKYEEAEPLLKRVLEIREEVLGANHPDTASVLNNLAALYRSQGKYEEAETLLKRALEIREEVLGAKHPDTASALNNLTMIYTSQGKYEEAEPLLKRVLEIREEVLGANHPDTATSLNSLAMIYYNQGKYEKAEPLLKRALEIREEVLGANHPDTATSLNNLAIIYYNQGKYEEAEPLLKRALEIREEVLGANHPNTATSLNNLATIYTNQGRDDEAESLYRKALELREEVLGTNHPNTATYLNNLAMVYTSRGKYDEAEPLLKRALEIREEVLGANHPDTATSLNNLAMVYTNQGRYDEAKNTLNKAMEILRKIWGSESLNVAKIQNELAILYFQEKKYNQALELFQQDLVIYEKLSEGEHSDVASIYSYISIINKNIGNMQTALEYGLKAVDIFIKKNDKNNLANSYRNIRNIYKEIGKLEEAINFQRKCIRIIIEFDDNKNLGVEYMSLGDIYFDKSNYEDAINCYNEALRLDDNITDAWLGLEKVYLKLDDYEKTSEVLYNLGKSKEKKLFEENLKSSICITGVEINNLNFMKSIEWELTPRVNILLGRNGYGKTYLFRLILSLLQRNSSQSVKFFDNCDEKAFVKVYIKKNDISALTYRIKTLFQKSFGIVPVLGIPNTRLIDKSSEYVSYVANTEDIDLKLNGAYNFIYERMDESRIKRFLYELGVIYLSSNRNFKAEIFTLIEKVVFNLTENEFRFNEIKLLDNGAAFQILVNTENSEIPIPFQKVSEGTLSIIVIFGLIYSYLQSIHKNSSNVPKENGIVFIDEIDAHLHPEWQRKIVPLLRNTFPNVQFFLTAHSPLVVSGCFENEVSVLRKKEKGDFSLYQFSQNFIGSSVAELFKRVFEVEETDEAYLYYSALYPFKREIEKEIIEIEEKQNPSAEDVEQLEKLYSEHRYTNVVKEKQDEKDGIGDLNNKLISLEIENKLLKKELEKYKDICK